MIMARFGRVIACVWAVAGLYSQLHAADSIELVLRGAPGFRHAGYWLAQWQGYFADEELDVTIRVAGRREDLATSVLASDGVYVIGGDEMLVARLHGRPIVMVAAINQETEQALAIRPGFDWAELGGRSIALRSPIDSVPVRLMLRGMGLGPAESDWTVREFSAAGSADTDEAANQTNVFSGGSDLVRPADRGVLPFYGDSLFVGESELAHFPKRVARVRRALLRGWRDAMADPGETIRLLQAQAGTLGLNRSLAELEREAGISRGLIKPSVVELGTIELKRLNEMAEGLVELGLAEQVMPLENFVYRPPFDLLKIWLLGVAGSLVLAVLVALGVMGFNLRLRRRVAESTRQLRDSQERFQSMFEHAPVAIVEEDFTAVLAWMEERRNEGVKDFAAWLHDHPDAVMQQYGNVRTVRANQAALESVGVDRVQDYVRCTRADDNPSLRHAFRQELFALWFGESDLKIEMSFTRVDGSQGDGLLQWTVPVIGEKLDYSRVLVVMTEVSELRATEQKLSDTEQRFRTLFESAVEGVYESTPGEGIVSANPAFAKMLGFLSPEQFLSWCRTQGASSLYANEGRRREFFEDLQDQDMLYDFESEVVCLDGSIKWISENVRAIRDEGGGLIRLQGFVSDISERKRFERELGEERERLAVTLRAMSEGVITTDHRGLVQFVNDAAEHLTGWAEGAAIGKPLSEVCSLRHQQSRASVPLPFEAAMQGEVAELPRATTLVDRLGRSRLVEGRCAPIHDLNSRAVGVVFVLHDVTARARHEEEMQRSAKLESLGVLAGGIAHDFNNLLTVVLGNLHLALNSTEAAAAAGRWLTDAESAGEKARDLTMQLLTFSKGGSPVKAAVDLPSLVREAADFALHGAKVKSRIVVARDLWPADVDKGQVGQVVQNLVLNAVQAMPEGGLVTLRLHNIEHDGDPVRSIAPGAYLRLEIEDHGKGIRADNLSRIFDPYFSTKSEGSGLGLATVYSIIKNHHGHVEVESELNKGTLFKILLPALPGARTRSEEKSDRLSTVGSGRVLFLDDEENICRMAEDLIAHLGMTVETVQEGESAVKRYFEALATNDPFDVIIVDLTVPGGMGGEKVVERIRKTDPAVRAIVSSGYSTDPVMADFRAYGFASRVIKPYRARDLARALQDAMAAEDENTPA